MKFCQNVIQEVSYRFPSSPRGWTFRLPQLEKNWMFPNNFEMITPLRRSSLPFYHRKTILKKKKVLKELTSTFAASLASLLQPLPLCPLPRVPSLLYYIFFFLAIELYHGSRDNLKQIFDDCIILLKIRKLFSRFTIVN